MSYEEFVKTLKRVKLTRAQFAELVGMGYHSVTNWKHLELPGWVAPFLFYYEKGQKLDELVKIVQTYKQDHN